MAVWRAVWFYRKRGMEVQGETDAGKHDAEAGNVNEPDYIKAGDGEEKQITP